LKTIVSSHQFWVRIHVEYLLLRADKVIFGAAQTD